MRNEISITETAATIEEAINNACQKIGYRRDECQFEIIDRPRKRFFGLRQTPAKVRVFIEVPEDEVEKTQAPQKTEPKKQEKAPQKQEASKAPQREQAKAQPKPAPAKQKQARPQGRPSEKQKQPVKQQPSAPVKAVITADGPVVDGPEAEIKTQQTENLDQEKVTTAVAYVTNIIKGLGIEVSMNITEVDNGLHIAIYGNSLGTIIGRRGETLDAIQYLTGLVTNRLEGEYLRVTVDCGDYRKKREQTLVELADRLAKQVLDTNVSKTLEPMSPSERRVIHATVANIEGVSSHSVGHDPTRRVVIKTPTSTNRRSRRDRRRRTDNRQNDNRRNQRPAQTREPAANRPSSNAKPTPAEDIERPKVVEEAPLYGKVDLD